MANNVSKLEKAEKPQDGRKEYFGLPKDVIVAFHCKFRSSCSRFSLSKTEFFNIFDPDFPFETWDPDQLEMADALEIFAGMVVLSDMALEDQAKFLFDLFDFNEMNSLSDVDLELMIASIVSALLKVFQRHKGVDIESVSAMVLRLVPNGTRVNFSQVYNFLKNSPEVERLFVNIGKPLPCFSKPSAIEETRALEDPQSSIPAFLKKPSASFLERPFEFWHGARLLNSSENKSKIRILSSFAGAQMSPEVLAAPIRSSKLQLSWAYGFSCDSSIRSFLVKTAKPDASKALKAKDRLIYFVSKIVVVYYYRLEKQAHYIDHTNEVCCIAVSSSGNICASGQKGKSPCVLVWNVGTLETTSSIALGLETEAYILEFINNDKFLVVLCKRPDPSVQVFYLDTNERVLSTYLNDFVVWVEPIADLSGTLLDGGEQTTGFKGWDVRASFVCYSAYTIYAFCYAREKASYIIRAYPLFDKPLTLMDGDQEERITGGAALYTNRGHLELVIYQSKDNFDVVFYCGTSKGNIIRVDGLLDAKAEPQKACLESVAKGSAYTALIYFRQQYLAAVSDDYQIAIIDTFAREAAQHVDLKESSLTLGSMQIKNIERGENGKLFLSSHKGNLFCLSFPEKNVWNKQQLSNVVKIKQFPAIFKISKGLNSICLVERNRKEKSIYVGGNGNGVIGVSSLSREITDVCAFEDNVTCFDCFVQPMGGSVFAFGTDQGRVRIRFDCEMAAKCFKCESPITVLKFSDDGSYIVACTSEPSLVLFSYNNGTYFRDLPKIPFGYGVPISINFCVNMNEFIIGTNLLRYHLVKISEFRERSMPELPNAYVPKCKLVQTKYVSAATHHHLPVIVAPDIGVIVIGESEGIISVYDSIQGLKENSATFYYGHCSNISGLRMSAYRDKLYSIAIADGCLLEWRIELTPRLPPVSTKAALPESGEGCIQSIRRQIIANSVVGHRPLVLYDSFGYFRSYSNNYLRRIFGEKFSIEDEKDNFYKRYPPFSLKLKHVYGYDAYNYRHNVLYVHNAVTPKELDNMQKRRRSQDNFGFRFNYGSTRNLQRRDSQPNDVAKLASVMSMTHRVASKFKNKALAESPALSASPARRLPESSPHSANEQTASMGLDFSLGQESHVYSQHIGFKCSSASITKLQNFSDQWTSMISCPLKASHCRREVLYFASRVIVIVDPRQKHDQRFYLGHSSKVSTVTLHPYHSLVASGETAHHPKIHIWQAQSCSTLTVINTYHKLGIMCLRFTYNKDMVISVSVDGCASIQVSEWFSGKIVAFRNTSSAKIIDLQVDSSDPHLFVTCTSSKIDFWLIQGSSIVNSSFIDFEDISIQNSLTSIVFMYYWSQGALQKDLLAATAQGQILIVRNGRLLKAIKLAREAGSKSPKRKSPASKSPRFDASRNPQQPEAEANGDAKESAINDNMPVNLGPFGERQNSHDDRGQRLAHELFKRKTTLSQEFALKESQEERRNLPGFPNDDRLSHASEDPLAEPRQTQRNGNRPDVLPWNEHQPSQNGFKESKDSFEPNGVERGSQDFDLASKHSSLPFGPNIRELKKLQSETLANDHLYSSEHTSKAKHFSATNVFCPVNEKLPINLIKLFVIHSETFIFIATDDNVIRIYNLDFELVGEIPVAEPPCDASTLVIDYQRTIGEPHEAVRPSPHGFNANPETETAQQANLLHYRGGASELKSRSNGSKAGAQSLDLYLTASHLLLLVSLSSGRIVEVELRYSILESPASTARGKVSFGGAESKILAESHASQNFHNIDNDFNFIYQKRVYFSINPSQKVMATCGDDKFLHFWDFESKARLLTIGLENIPTCIKFSPSGKILVVGLQNGHVMVFEPEITKDPKRAEHGVRIRLGKPAEDIDPMLSGFSSGSTGDAALIEKPVLNVEFSLKGDLLAVAHDNTKLTAQRDNLKDRGTAIVIVYVSNDSPLKEHALQHGQNKYFAKYAEVRLASLNYADTSKLSYLGVASYFMAFSDDDTYLMLYYQNINEHHIRENHDKEGKYIIWNFKSKSSEINWEILKSVQFRNNNFPNHIFGVNSFAVTDELERDMTLMQKAELREELANNQIVLSAITNYNDVCFLGSDQGDIFLAKKTLFALKQEDSPENLPKAQLCQAKRYPAHTSFVNQIEISSNGRTLFTTGISDECVFQWEIVKVEAKNELDHMTRLDVKRIEKEHYRYFSSEDFLAESNAGVGEQGKALKAELLALNDDGESMESSYEEPNSNQNISYSQVQSKQALNNSTLSPINKATQVDQEINIDKAMQRIHLTKDRLKDIENRYLDNAEKRFINNLVEIYPQRKKLASLHQDIDISLFPMYRLQPIKILGRSAMSLRFNVAIVSNKSLIYAAGTSLIMKKLAQGNPRNTPPKQKSSATGESRRTNNFLNQKTLSIEGSHPLVSNPDLQRTKTLDKPELSAASDLLLNSLPVAFKAQRSDSVVASQEHCLSQDILFAGKTSDRPYASEIACLELGSDGHTLCVGTNDIYALILVWCITSNSLRGSMALNNCISPQFIRVSGDMRTIIVVGLVQSYNACVYLVDIQDYKVIALLDFMHSAPMRIWDACFMPKHNDKFISVGLIHASYWKYCAEVLSFKELKLESPMALGGGNTKGGYNQSEEEEDLETCFFVIKFLNSKAFVIACSKGNIYLWHKKEIKVQRNVYENSPVSTIAQNPRNACEFFTAGFAVPFHYYRVNQHSDYKGLEKLFEVDIFKSLGLVNIESREKLDALIYVPDFQVQTLAFADEGHVIYGCRNGNLGEFYLPEELKKDKPSTDHQQPKESYFNKQANALREKCIEPLAQEILLAAFDDHVPKVADFAHDASKIFCVSEKGLFLVYEFGTLQNEFRYNFAQDTLDMIVLRSSIILVFQTHIKVVAVEDDGRYRLDKNAVEFVTKTHKINKIKVDPGQKFMAIAFHGQADSLPLIEIYSIDEVYEKLHTIETEEIELMDFSSHDEESRNYNNYLLIQEVNGSLKIYNFRFDQLKLENNSSAEWTSEGYLISPNCKALQRYYTSSNPMVSIVKIDKGTLIVNDLLGTVI